MQTSRKLSPLVALIAGQICLHASMAGLRMAVPLQVLRAGGADYMVGALLALFSVAPIALALPAGRLADRRGYHLPLRTAVALSIAGALTALGSLYAGKAQYPLLCVAALLSGAGGNIGLITIQRTAGRSATDPVELKRVFSWLGIAPSASNFVGPLGAGVLIDQIGFWAAFSALSLLPLLSLLIAPWVPREPPRVVPHQQRRPAWDLLATPGVRPLLLVNWFMSVSWDAHSFLIPVLGHERGFSASAIGSVLGVFALSVTAVRLLISVLARHLSEVRVLTGAMLGVALVFAAYPFATSIWAMLACASLLGFALGCSQPMVMTTLHQITPHERHGEAIALRSMALNASSAVMPLSFGAIGTALGASGLFWAMGTVVGLGVFAVRALPQGARTEHP